jgi:hypothetical protein
LSVNPLNVKRERVRKDGRKVEVKRKHLELYFLGEELGVRRYAGNARLSF